jgi:hypothetical protein
MFLMFLFFPQSFSLSLFWGVFDSVPMQQGRKQAHMSASQSHIGKQKLRAERENKKLARPLTQAHLLE